jgi:tRNA nucleotidyltransferase (CCA-adding enzyme)
MHVILTHEQADFDALAALLSAHILNERALAVLPRRMNRNVRAFLNLYGTELPFIEARDLPAENIETLTLVDTQSLITLKGLTRSTQVHVIDHHPLRSDLPADWQVLTEKLGAVTTVFVENIQEHNGPLSMLQATLLLLGIYEDTGSLTYANTTSRDVRAVAFLLDQGANLQLIKDYLNPPLSDGQQEIYTHLLANMETLQIHGQQIVISMADGRELDEEISSIAHKMRDMLDPDALFLLVNTREGIRLVARSTTDRVDVALAASIFGGGGHVRAAAALIKSLDGMPKDSVRLEQVYQRLVDVLPRIVEAAITVEKIMSNSPRTLTPETPAQEASRLMQRYGYEGYPVVKEYKVLGLLTRRAVDRALAHKLNLPAASLMDAGEVVVFPKDPVEKVQQLMAETGWGQIPVVQPEDGKIIGIVTRTDLLKLIGGGDTTISEHNNLSQRLSEALPPVRLELLRVIANIAHTQHQPVYIVGGFVRDLLLDRPSLDFDIVVEGDAISLAQSLQAEYGGRVTSHSRFGTAKWQIHEIHPQLFNRLAPNSPYQAFQLPDSLDFISARTEFYNYPTALPTVERGSIKLDLHRRDFTINTLALRLDGRYFASLYDYWGGLADLQKGLVRVLHSLSFVDDPTRMLRAVRFETRFGFQIEQRTLQLMNEAHDLMRQVSGDRLRHELDLILAEDDPTQALARLQEIGLLTAIHAALLWNTNQGPLLNSALQAPLPEGWNLPDMIGAIPLRRALAYLVWLMPLPAEQIQGICQRLRFPQPLTAAILSGSALLEQVQSLTLLPPSRVVARLDQTPLAAIYGVYLSKDDSAVRRVLDQYAREWLQIQPLTDGFSLQAMGVEPGPVYRQILWALRAARLDGKVSTREQERALLNQILDMSAGG